MGPGEGRPACDFWFSGNDLSGVLPMTVGCDVQWNELYLGDNPKLKCGPEEFPCVRAAYCHFGGKECDKSKCKKCGGGGDDSYRGAEEDERLQVEETKNTSQEVVESQKEEDDVQVLFQ